MAAQCLNDLKERIKVISQSWTPANVKLRQIRKDAPIVQRQAVFADHSSKSFWVWGGLNENKTQSQTELWKFTADGQGGGSWAIDEKLNQDQADFHRSHGGAFTSASSSAFYIGGMEETTTAIKPDMPNGGYMSGFVSFNFTSSSQDRVWRNTTEAPYSKSKTLYAASAQYIPKFGSQGLIMILGGAHYDAASTKSNDNAMDIVWLMDPVTRTWYSQQTTGDSPPARRWSCTVGAKSLNDTYEIFIFGGHVDGRIGFGDIWILSLPGFVWARAAYAKTPRAQMGCVVAGRRQLITVGGVDPTLLSSQLLSTKDPLDQGLGIFDLTKLQWKTQHDHDAAAYDSPDVIKSWYGDPENLSNVQYNEGVATLFNSSFGRDRSSDAKDNHVGPLSPAAMGVIVGGSIIAAVLLGGFAFMVLRRRKGQGQRGSKARPFDNPEDSRAELGIAQSSSSWSHNGVPGMAYATPAAELQALQSRVELDGQDSRGSRVELDASEKRRSTEQTIISCS